RRALSIRFEVIWSHLHLALTEPDKDPEHVHQLRVGTRRATAALDIFADCLPAKVYKTARKQLRRIRRAAGAARDWDVFRMTVQDRPRRRTDNQQPGVDLLMGYTLAQRDIAQQHLETAATGVDLARLASAAVTAVSDPGGDRPLLDLARLMLRQL